MFQKLKIQLISINVLSITIVLILVFTGIYGMMYRGMQVQSVAFMKSIATQEKLYPFLENPDQRTGFQNSFFVKLDQNNQIISYSPNASIPKSDIEAAKKIALDVEKNKGTLSYKQYHLRYLYMEKPYGAILVFMDNMIQIFVLKSLIFASLIIGAISISIVCLISWFLANKAIIPVKNTWEEHKEFIADASHELRTPLAVINSNFEIVIENEEDSIKNQSKWLNNIQSELGRMEQLVDGLLFLARADAREIDDYTEYFSITDQALQVIEVFSPIANKNGIKIMLDGQDEVHFQGNQFKMRQLLTILMDNAIKHTPTGGKVTLLVERKAQKIILTVKDTGEGIPKEDIKRIFNRFYRVDKSRSRNNGGSGLGLAIAKSIVEEYHGKIIATSEIAQGSTFIVTFPI